MAGGGYIEHAGEAYIIRGEGMMQNPEEIGRIIVDNRNGTPITVAQIGEVKVGHVTRIGAATMNGEGEAVIGLTLMLAGENGKVVAERVKEEIKKILPSLPPGVTIEPFYDRSDLVSKVIKTVSKNLVEGAILVIAILFFLLGDIRGGLIVASAIPLSMLIAFTGMLYGGISGNLMSLGAIDFGLIVDGAVVMIENIVRHLNEKRARREEIPHVILEAGREVLAADLLCRRNHHYRLSADSDARRRRRQDVSAHGDDGYSRVDRIVGAHLYLDAGARLVFHAADVNIQRNLAHSQGE